MLSNGVNLAARRGVAKGQRCLGDNRHLFLFGALKQRGDKDREASEVSGIPYVMEADEVEKILGA